MVIWDKIKELMAAGEPVFIIGLKGRQQGYSTFCQALSMWRSCTVEGHRSMTVAHKRTPAGSELFSKAELMWESMPDWIRPSLASGKSTGRQLKFAAPLRSYLVVETAEEGEAVGRSGSFKFAHCTELPFWAKAEETMSALMACVPAKPGSMILVESTARGMGDWFHRQWLKAIHDVENGNKPTFHPVFVAWFLTEEYARDRTELDKPLSGSERKRMKLLGINERQILWYRDLLNANPDLAQQEYPDTWQDAFLSSGLPFFRAKDLQKHIERANLPENQPKRKGNWRVSKEKGKTRARFLEDDQGPLWIWKPPIKGHNYVVSVDASSGRAKDNTAYHVLDVDDMEIVATYQGRAQPDEVAVESILTAKLYNNALWAPERNNMGATTVTKGVKEIGYDNIYQYRREDTTTGKLSIEYGWNTSTRTRTPLLESFAELIHSHRLKIYCIRTLEEMERFIFVDELGKRAEAAAGCHDDMVMSCAIAVKVKDSAAGSLEFDVVHWGKKLSSKGGY